MDVSRLHDMPLVDAVLASAKDWRSPADWPVFDQSRLGIWNIRIGVPERSRGVSVRPYWTPGIGGSLTDAEIRKLLPPQVAVRVLSLVELVHPPRPKKPKAEEKAAK